MRTSLSRSLVSSVAPSSLRFSGYRTKLLVAMMLLVSAVTAVVLYLAEHNFATTIERELQREFESELTALHNAQAIRHAALVERCRALVQRPRIHAALEDNALDLLYPSAEGELRDVMPTAGDEVVGDRHGAGMHARFYRFLDRNGRVLTAPPDAPVGKLSPAVESELTLPALNTSQQVGYVATADTVTEVIATPIISTETGEVIAALVLGFKPLDLVAEREMKSGIWTGGRLQIPLVDSPAAHDLAAELATVAPTKEEGRFRATVDGVPHLVFFQRLNPGSAYPPAYEVSLYPLEQFAARQTRMRFEVLGFGLLLLLSAFVASRALAGRLSAPVEKLAADSERSARFSADASHQLKTPVTVLRAGLEELLTRDNLTQNECDAIAALIHQTYRLSSLIEDLLLLSRMDSGRLQLALRPTDLSHLIAAALDDVSAIPDAMPLEIETDVPAVLQVTGDQRYTAIILQNLLENARKYNRPGGRIRVAARIEGDYVVMSVGNTGAGISPTAQANIFERFHRGAMGENVPGYGLGLNLARELARLHGGDLQLVRSGGDWTEFAFRVPLAQSEVHSR